MNAAASGRLARQRCSTASSRAPKPKALDDIVHREHATRFAHSPEIRRGATGKQIR